jgi:hypothetical protein
LLELVELAIADLGFVCGYYLVALLPANGVALVEGPPVGELHNNSMERGGEIDSGAGEG